MTWRNVPWALDGATIPSSLARLGQYVSTSGAEGIAQLGDLKVLPLSTPGNGVRVLAGGAVVLNRYQGETPDQSYVVYNPTEDVLGPTQMPASSGTAKSHLVCVVVGDAEFSQTGHPFMLSTDPPSGQQNTFQYVRTIVIQNVPANTKDFDSLNLNYPGYALARLDVPASTTTITSGMIVDLRKMARPRREEVMWHVATSSNDILDAGLANGAYEYFPDQSQNSVDIPKWASYAYVSAWVEGIRIDANVNANFRFGSIGMGIATGASHLSDTYSAGVSNRRHISIGGLLYIPAAYRGTTQNFQIQAGPAATGTGGHVFTDAWTTAFVNMRFVEIPD